jgi:hypothetical protein
LLTDHEPLKWLMTNEKLTGMHARWAHILSEYDFEIKHRPGKRSGDADGLLRNPLQDETDHRVVEESWGWAPRVDQSDCSDAAPYEQEMDCTLAG